MSNTQTTNKQKTADIVKRMKMVSITKPEEATPFPNQAEVNKRNLHILETYLFGKLDGGGQSAMELLGRE